MDDLEKFRASWKKELKERKELEAPETKPKVNNKRNILSEGNPDGTSTSYAPFIIVDNLLDGKRDWDEAALDVGDVSREDAQKKRRKKTSEEKADCTSGFLETLISDLDEINDIPFFDIDIPRELGVKIFQYLSMKDLCNCAQVSSSWRSLADDQLLWFPIYKSLGFSEDVHINSETNWKAAVRDGLMQKDLLMANWKGRIGRVTTLDHVTGGVLCVASSCDEAVVAGFSNGSIKLWEVKRQVEKEVMLYSCNDNIGSEVNQVAVNPVISLASNRNGHVDIWSTAHGGDPIHHYDHRDGVQCVSIATKDAEVATASGKELRIEAADTSGQWITQDSITLDKYIEDMKFFPALDKKHQGCNVALMTSSGLYIYTPAPGARQLSLVYAFLGSGMPTCMEILSNLVACGFGAAGFQESFCVKLFDLETKSMKHILRGHTWNVTCINSSEALQNILVTGCKDNRVRLFDLRMNNTRPVMQLSGHGGAVTQVQVDDWKILSGGTEGMVCLWDQRMQRKLWDSYARHPVRHLHFNRSSLVTANIPNVKSLEDDLETVTHKRLRGELRHYNFLADQTREGLPSVCLSNYDEPEGYNYNIRLAAPYDDV